MYSCKKSMSVTIHGAVRFYAPAPVRAKRVPLAHSTAARPPSDKVVESVGIQPIAVGNSKWLDAVTIKAYGHE